jgi:hypothetical protein
MNRCSRAFPVLLLLVFVGVSWSCRGKDDPPKPKTATPPASTSAAAPAPAATPTAAPAPVGAGTPSAAVTPAPAAPASGQASTDCCDVVADPERKGRLGRLVVKFPDGTTPGNTRVDVYRPGEQTSLAGGYGSQMLDLMPGTYEVEISRKRILGVMVEPAHDTRVRVGVLRVTALANTRVDLLDAKDQRALTGGFGTQEFGLPVGSIQVKVAGQTETVTITAGQITEF